MTDPAVAALGEDYQQHVRRRPERQSRQPARDRQPGRLVLIHTETPDAPAGREIVGQLAQAVLKTITERYLTMGPSCPFAPRRLGDHHDRRPGVATDWTSPSR